MWKPSSQLHYEMKLKQGDTSPAKFNWYCWEPALKKIIPFLSAWYSFSRNADVTVAVAWPGCCRRNKEIICVRKHLLVWVPLWGNINVSPGPYSRRMFWSLCGFKHFVLQRWRGAPSSAAASSSSNKEPHSLCGQLQPNDVCQLWKMHPLPKPVPWKLSRSSSPALRDN